MEVLKKSHFSLQMGNCPIPVAEDSGHILIKQTLHWLLSKKKSQKSSHSTNRHGQCSECSATEMGQFPICKLKWDFLRTSVTACTNDKNVFSAPFGIFYVRTEI